MPKNLAILRLKKLARALREGLSRRALVFGVAPSIEHVQSFSRADYKTVIDVGANRGQFSLFASSHFPLAHIICFEPLERARSVLTKIFEDRPVVVYPFALGEAEKNSEFYITQDDDSSSLLALGSAQQTVFKSTIRTQQYVPVRRLDQILDTSDIIKPSLLKIDVQGGELGVLSGAEGLLPFFDDIYVECSYIELYKAQALATEVVLYLHSNGFRLAGVFNQIESDDIGAVQADFLFTKLK